MGNHVLITDYLWFQEGPGVRNTQYTSSGVKLLNVANFVDGNIDLSTSSRYISDEEAYGKYKHFLVDEGDFLIASSGIQVDYFEKKMGFIRPDQLPLCMNTSTIRFKNLEPNDLDMRYFMYYLKSNAFKNQLAKHIVGSAQLNFGPSHLKKMTFPVVNIEKQRYIVENLDKLYTLIALRKEQLAKLDQLVKSRFIELFGTVKNNPHGYPVVKIGECAKLQGGFAFKSSDYIDDGIRLVQISNVNKDTLDWDSVNYVPQAFLQKYKDFELHIGDLVLAMTRPVIKSLDAVKIATVSEYDVPSLLNQRVGRFVIDRAKLNVVYLMSCCQMTEFREYVEAMSGNSLQPNISSKQVENYSIILPPMELQEQFASFVKQTDKSKVAIQHSLNKLELLKKSLMQEYFG